MPTKRIPVPAGRVCQGPDCEESLDGRDARQKFCCGNCRTKSHRAAVRPPAPPVAQVPARSTAPARSVGVATGIPEELTSRDRWVRWQARKVRGRVTKLPLDAAGRVVDATNPTSWSSYLQVRSSAAGDGVGLVLGDGLAVVDLDDVLDESGHLTVPARRLLARLPRTWTEVSPSGRGLHLWFRGAWRGAGLGQRLRAGVKVETYCRLRYVTVTGKTWPGSPVHLAAVPPNFFDLLG